jgi:hypothetical protein
MLSRACGFGGLIMLTSGLLSLRMLLMHTRVG